MPQFLPVGLRAVQLFAQGYTAGKDAVHPYPPASKTYPHNESRDGKQILPRAPTLTGWYGSLESVLRRILMS